MKVIKRNQIIILVISLMLITAGYLNFTTNNNSLETAHLYAELGDATLVSTNALVENDVLDEENAIVENDMTEENTEEVENSNLVETSVEKMDDTYFATSKLERENMYSQILETYQHIYNDNQSSSEQKVSALDEITKINKTKNAIMIAENLLYAKGFENIIIFVNENSVSVIVGKPEVLAEEIAQIQNIVSRELNVDVGIIHISTK